jgi:hypothetical protein
MHDCTRGAVFCQLHLRKGLWRTSVSDADDHLQICTGLEGECTAAWHATCYGFQDLERTVNLDNEIITRELEASPEIRLILKPDVRTSRHYGEDQRT